MQPMPMSPRQSPKEIGSAAVQWACTRRGRTLVLAVVAFTILLGLGGIHNREVGHNFPDVMFAKERCRNRHNVLVVGSHITAY